MSEIQIYSKFENPIEAFVEYGNIIASSGMFGCTKPEQGQILAAVCITEQKTPTEIINKFHLMDGKLSRKTGSAYSDFRSRGGKVKWKRTGQETDQDPENREAIGLFQWEGEEVEVRFSMEDARKANLVKPRSAWESFPAKMLRARVLSDGIGMLAPEIYYEDDFDSAGVPEKMIKLVPEEKPASTDQEKPKRKSKPESKIQDAEIVDEKPRLKPAESPSPKPAEEKPAEDPKPKAEVKPETKSGDELPDEILTKVENAIGGGPVAIKAGKWLKKNGWIPEGGHLGNLSEENAHKIINYRDSFLKRVEKEVE